MAWIGGLSKIPRTPTRCPRLGRELEDKVPHPCSSYSSSSPQARGWKIY